MNKNRTFETAMIAEIYKTSMFKTNNNNLKKPN